MSDTPANAKAGFFATAFGSTAQLELSALEVEFYRRLMASGFTISSAGVITLTQPPIFAATSLTGITNANIASNAAIAYSKLNLSASIVDADVANAAAIAWSKLSKTGSSLADLTTRSAGDLSSGTLSADRLPAGSIRQVVGATYGTQTISSSSTFADTGLSLSITPTSASNKVLVLVQQAGCGKDTGATWLQLKLKRDTTDIVANFEAFAGSNGGASQLGAGGCGCVYLDSPATTSAVTYKTQFASSQNIAQVYVQANSSKSSIVLMEVVG